MPAERLPESDQATLRAHEVTDPQERLRWLTQLEQSGEPVSLFAAGHARQQRLEGHRAQQLHVDIDAGLIELRFDPTHLGAGELSECLSGPCIAVALLEGVRLQFNVIPLQDRGDRRATGRWLTLRAALPTQLARLQRRDAFRVTPPTATPAQLWLPLSDRPDDERRLDLADISATGLAFYWPLLAGSPPPVGTLLQDCRLELPASLPIRCTLIVSDVTSGEATDSARHRVGCAIGRLDSASARAIQVYVNTAQIKARAKRPTVVTDTAGQS